MSYYRPDLKQKARGLRSNLTDGEKILWSKLRRKQICGVQFYRQRPIENFIVDFFAPRVQLVIELDGSQHFFEHHEKSDALRDGRLTKLGLEVLRFSNLQIFKQLSDVLALIHDRVEEKLG